MTTHAITRAPVRVEAARHRALAAAAAAPPPDPAAWFSFLCQRCDKPFKVQGIWRLCATCFNTAASRRIIGSETIGEVSGA